MKFWILRHKGMLAVLTVSLLLNCCHLHWGLPNDVSWSNDSISPHQPLRVADVFASGSSYKYPLLQSWIDYTASLPVLTYWSILGSYDFACRHATPVCFPDYYHQLSVLIMLHRLMSVLMAIGVLIGMYRLSTSLFYDRLGATLAAATMASSYAFVQFSHLANVDVPLLFWFTWSLLYFVRLIKTGATSHYIMFGVLAACALSTKEAVVGAYLGVGLVILIENAMAIRRDPETTVASTVKKIALLLAALGIVYGTINNVWFNYSGFAGHVQFWFSMDGGVNGFWQRPFSPVDLIARMLRYFRIEMGSVLALFAVGGLLYGLFTRIRETCWMLLPALSYTLFLMFFIQFYSIRFGLPLIALLAPFTGLVGARMLTLRPRIACASAILLALIYGYSQLDNINANILMINDSRYTAEKWIQENIDHAQPIGVFSMKTYLPRLELLGYEMKTITPESLQQSDGHSNIPEYLVMTSKYYSRFSKSFKRKLFGGELGYREVWSYRYRSPIAALIRFRAVDRVNPRIVILSRTTDG